MKQRQSRVSSTVVSQNVGKVIKLSEVERQVHHCVTIEDAMKELDFGPISPIAVGVIILNEAQSSYAVTVKGNSNGNQFCLKT